MPYQSKITALSPSVSQTVQTPPRTYTVAESTARPADSIGLDELAKVLWRRKWTVAGAAFAGMAIAVIVALQTAPTYRARTSLALQGFNETFLRDVTPVTPTVMNATAESYVQNQVKILQSETLARRVAARLDIQPPAGSSGVNATVGKVKQVLGIAPQRTPTETEQRSALVKEAITVRTSLQSQVVELFYDARDPNKAAAGATAAAEEFIAMNRDARDELVQSTTEWLTRETAALKVKLENSVKELQDYARSAGLLMADGQNTVSEERLRQIQQTLATAEAERAARQSRYEAVAASPIEGLPDVLAAGPLHQYQTERETLRRQLAEFESMYTPAHYKVQRVRAQIAQVDAAIATERAEIVGRMRAEYNAALKHERILAKSYGEQLRQVQIQSEKAGQYHVRKREVETSQALYDLMLQKVKEAGAASALRASNVRVIDAAMPPLRPYTPNLPLNLAIGLGVGSLTGVGLAFVRERTGRVNEPGDTALVDVPELGVIPSARDDRGFRLPGNGHTLITAHNAEEGLALATWKQDGSLLSESFRAILASVLFTPGVETGSPNGLVLTIASREAMEGKTTVATNLAIALAETDRRVMLVDADLRRPRLHHVFNLSNDRGLTDLIRDPQSAEGAAMHTIAQETPVPKLWVLAAGPGAPSVSRLLYSENLKTILRRLRMEFDVVLIDSPPLLLFPDARVLGRMSDGLVMVVRANRTTREELRTLHQRLLQDGITVLGAVLNDWKVDAAHHAAYGSYYKRYQRETHE